MFGEPLNERINNERKAIKKKQLDSILLSLDMTFQRLNARNLFTIIAKLKSDNFNNRTISFPIELTATVSTLTHFEDSIPDDYPRFLHLKYQAITQGINAPFTSNTRGVFKSLMLIMIFKSTMLITPHTK